jgi:hypothetical protein
MRITIKDPNGRVVGSADGERVTISDARLHRHLAAVMRQGIPVGPDAGVQGRPGAGLVLDYLNRAGYSLEADHGVKKAPGISADGGSESPDPGHVVGDTSPGHLIGPVRRARRISKDMGSAGAPMTGGMVSTPVAGSGIKPRRRQRP